MKVIFTTNAYDKINVILSVLLITSILLVKYSVNTSSIIFVVVICVEIYVKFSKYKLSVHK